MVITDTLTGEELEAFILPVTSKDFLYIKKSGRFVFNWDEYKNEEVYKLVAKDDTTILGLMCIAERAEEGFEAVEIRLLEVATEHIGKNKKLEGIAGCLIAYSCRQSIKFGHQGFIFLKPKTDLVKHYRTKYGLIPFGVHMMLDDIGALRLISRYIERK